MKTLVCIDRDGTLIYDDKYYLGRQENWEELIEFLPGVLEGVKELHELEDAGLYMITNQSGVAVEDFEKLTEERAHEVCQEILDRLAKKGVGLDGYFLCSHVNPKYTERRSERSFNHDFVCECNCIKPNLGMVFDALEEEGVTRENVNLYVIGDRASDVKTGLNAGGCGILVPFENEPGEDDKVREEFGNNNNVYIAEGLVDAADFIKRRESSEE